MKTDDKYLFDLTGYLVLKDVLTSEEVAQLNAGIDRHRDLMSEIGPPAVRRLKGRWQGHLAAQRPRRYARLESVPIASRSASCWYTLASSPISKKSWAGGYRLDHGPGLIAMDTGCEGGLLHGGGVERGDISEVYFFKNDRIFTGLTVVEYLLADEGPGDGGVAVIPGSHKANLACPKSMIKWEQHQEHVLEVNVQGRRRSDLHRDLEPTARCRGRPHTSGERCCTNSAQAPCPMVRVHTRRSILSTSKT